MKALVYEGSGRLALAEREVPTIGEDEVLIRVSHVGICGTDMLVAHDGLARVKPPVVLGHEFSGYVERVGNPASSLQPGDRVVVEPLVTCGSCSACASGSYNVCAAFKLIGVDVDGAMAPYVKVPEKTVYRIQDATAMEDAAFVEPLAVGVHMVRMSGLQARQTAMIAGGGPIGLIAAKVAQLKGADVYVSEVNPFRIEFAKALGFSLMNPQEQNVAQALKAATGGYGAHVTFEATGTNHGWNDCIEAAGTHGTVLIAGLPKKPPTIDGYQLVAKELKVVGSRVYTAEDYREAIRLIEDGLFRPQHYISKTIPLDEAIEHGFQAIDRGEPVMKILIQMNPNEGR
ncbi:zinc-dependent alcohol dehydrogenase [Paenibacillus thalictri]|uniref:Enoyl reductase (ER) domain-containing protein n=1 Tax=Paenibacillus thalictri TaxID=2527873 RepID=A0A4Q9DMX7_9BACL|nr:alcohol dehydrogenase catalytic domain-containing protein [Paenibacillus thalictri]TBL73276.1 hypothetical protein EYB31_26715 [Paenibacillus thalictri]